jgi:hypothetical protein
LVNKIDIPLFHLQIFSSRTIRKALERAGFSSIKIKYSVLGVENPPLVHTLGRCGEAIARFFMNFVCAAVFILSFGNLIVSPSMIIYARKEKR